jgi:hypothetical protein
VLAGAGALVASSAGSAEPVLALVGQDAPINLSARSATDISAHNSPTLARNPVRRDNLAVSSRIDTPFYSCGLHVSFDGGATWRQTAIPAPEGEEAKCFSPDVAFSADGRLYLSFVTLAGRGNVPNALWLSTSDDGGRTLSDPARIHGPLTFGPRLAVDPLAAGRVSLVWLQARDVGRLQFTAPGNPILAARSEDGGRTFATPVRVSSAARGRVVAPAPVVDRDGDMYVLYLDLEQDRLDYEGGHDGRGGPPYPGTFTLVLARSEDGGRSWQESVVDTDVAPIDRFVVFLAAAPSVAVDGDGRVYAAVGDARYGDPDVLLWVLDPGAAGWRGPIRVNDTPRGDGRAQYLPRLAVAADGRLDAVYYDRRDDPRDVMNTVSLQSSFDAGRTFAPALTLSSRPFDSRIGFGAKEGLPDLGSRLASIADDRAALAVWTDTRAGTPATQKQDLAEAAVAVTPPDSLSSHARTALRIGGAVLIALGLAGAMLAVRRRSV